MVPLRLSEVLPINLHVEYNCEMILQDLGRRNLVHEDYTIGT